ncbi:MAG: hypothetical protein JRI68_14185 [Deltaproteobacteria bacterium]|nr:hypothetical protein [Deltaproteobacteria bacterium]
MTLAVLLLAESVYAQGQGGAAPTDEVAAPGSTAAEPGEGSGSDDDLLAELAAAESADAAATAEARGADATKAANVEAEDPFTLLPEGAQEVVGNETNPSISIILDFAAAIFTKDDHFRQGGHAPTDNGPAIQGAELAASAPIDPFFEVDLAFGMYHLHVEEIYLTTTALPWNLQVRAGQFKSSIGRHNPTHLHQWHFVTHPVPNEFLFGAEGLTLPGAELSFLFPLPWYAELIGAWQMGDSGSFRTPFDEGVSAGDFIYPVRLVQFFDISDDWATQNGLNAVFGRSQSNPDLDNRTYAYGMDWMFKWRPIGWGETGYTYVSWTTEAWLRQMEVANDLWGDVGGYSDLIFGIDKEWEAAGRAEVWRRLTGFDENPEIARNSFGRDTFRASGAVSYLPSHFSRLRLQYTYESIEGFDNNHIVLIQTEVSAGAHGAHEY